MLKGPDVGRKIEASHHFQFPLYNQSELLSNSVHYYLHSTFERRDSKSTCLEIEAIRPSLVLQK